MKKINDFARVLCSNCYPVSFNIELQQIVLFVPNTVELYLKALESGSSLFEVYYGIGRMGVSYRYLREGTFSPAPIKMMNVTGVNNAGSPGVEELVGCLERKRDGLNRAFTINPLERKKSFPWWSSQAHFRASWSALNLLL